MNFLCIYLREKKGGGGALIHVYVLENIVSLYYRTALWVFVVVVREVLFLLYLSIVGMIINNDF